MNDLLLQPLEYYEKHGREEHKKNAEEHFDSLLSASGVDQEANRATVKKYDAELLAVESSRKSLSKKKILRTLAIIGIVLSALLLIFGICGAIDDPDTATAVIVVSVLALAGCIIAVVRLGPAIKAADQILKEAEAKAKRTYDEAMAQMAPLNALFDNTDTLKLIEKTLPDFSFDSKFSVENHNLFKAKYDFLDMQSDNSSVIDTISGRFSGNPFLYCHSLSHEMGTKTYVGTRVISWTETYRDSDGKMRTRTRTQTLTATVTKPFPEYRQRAYLCYGSQAAPDLSFDRTPKHTERLSEREIDRRVKSGERKLKKKAQKALKNGGNFQEMTNTEFDVLFGADNRDHEVQFRLMYTPLAQRNTVDLMTSDTGYGDDFHFNKRHRFNFISSEHSQNFSTDTSASNYYSHSVDLAREKFVSFNENYFKSIFFDFAPIFAVPAYLEAPSASLDGIAEYDSHYTYYEHEVMANAIGAPAFAHERTVTQSILNTHHISKSDKGDLVAVTARSYTAEPRIDYVPVLGGDGRMHSVPVPWDEYIPLEWTRNILISPAPVSEREIRGMNTDQTIDEQAYFHGMWARTV